ncbi:MAG: hypothetical protein KAY67_04630, partial [Aeromonadaceae bacterium]|nr:hypothetical protein [Aeromonadaceae bacterium]
FKIPRRSRRAGSIPASGTIKIKDLRRPLAIVAFLFSAKWRQRMSAVVVIFLEVYYVHHWIDWLE